MSGEDEREIPEHFPLLDVRDTDHKDLGDELPPSVPPTPPSQLDRIEALLARAHKRFDEIDTWREQVDAWREKTDGRLGDGNSRFEMNETNTAIAINALVDLLVRIQLPGEADRIRALVAKKPIPLEHLDG